MNSLKSCPSRLAHSHKAFAHLDLYTSSHVLLRQDVVCKLLPKPYRHADSHKVVQCMPKTLTIEKRDTVSKGRLKPAYCDDHNFLEERTILKKKISTIQL